MIETARLRLRLWRDDDIEHIDRIRSDERFMRYLGPRVDDALTELARVRTHWEEKRYGIWAVEDRESGRFVGRCGLQVHRLWPDDVELGWGIDPELWGRGYASEAATAALEHAFETVALPRVVSIVHPENIASIRVAEKLGERPYGTVYWANGDVDLTVFAVERRANPAVD